MRAINLIPPDERGDHSRAGRSGGAVYVLLGALALLVVLAGTYSLTSKSIHDRTAELADVTARADAAARTAGHLAEYAEFAKRRKERSDAVTALATARVDWAEILREIARTMPSDASLTSMKGTKASASGAAAPGASGSATTPPSGSPTVAAPAPTLELGGCTTSQRDVSRVMASLRGVTGVTDVRLASSAKGGASGSASATSSASASSAGPCSGDGRAQFTMTLSFKPAAGETTGSEQSATSGSIG
jgi:Tfp pilus assembly protein PilN